MRAGSEKACWHECARHSSYPDGPLRHTFHLSHVRRELLFMHPFEVTANFFGCVIPTQGPVSKLTFLSDQLRIIWNFTHQLYEAFLNLAEYINTLL